MDAKSLEKEFHDCIDRYSHLKRGKDTQKKWKQRMLIYLKMKQIIELQNVLAFIEEIKPDTKQRQLMELLIKSDNLKNY